MTTEYNVTKIDWSDAPKTLPKSAKVYLDLERISDDMCCNECTTELIVNLLTDKFDYCIEDCQVRQGKPSTRPHGTIIAANKVYIGER